jgi:glycosyltransferase involved in cell wall biosynthesis
MITIIVASGREFPYLERLLLSIVHSTLLPHELIIINDSKYKDKKLLSQKYIKNLETKGVIVYFFDNKIIIGPANSRNLGISIAKGKYLVFTDDDCEVDKDWLYNLMNIYKNESKIHKISGASGRIVAKNQDIFGKYFTIMGILNPSKKMGNNLVGANFMIDKSKISEDIRFDKRFSKNTGEDFELSLRLHSFGHNFLFIKDAIVYHHFKNNIKYLMNSFYRYGVGRRKTEQILLLNKNLEFNLEKYKYPRMKFIYPCIFKDFHRVIIHLINNKVSFLLSIWVLFIHVISRLSYNNGYRKGVIN